MNWSKKIKRWWKGETIALCQHDYRRTGEIRWDFVPFDGLSKIYQLRCQKCGHLTQTWDKIAPTVPLGQKGEDEP